MTPRAAEQQLALGSLVGRYLIVRRCAAASRVFVAVDPVLNRQVALKVYSVPTLGGAARAALLQQARAVAKVAHPNVVAVHDAGEVGDLLFVAMDLVEGPTLRTWQTTRRSRNELRAAYVQVIDALLALEAAGLRQPPFDPAVALVGADGRVRLLNRAQAVTEARSVDLAALLFAGAFDEGDEATERAGENAGVGERASAAAASVRDAALSSPGGEAVVSGSASERARTAATSAAEVAPSSADSEAAVSGSASERASTAATSVTEVAPSSPGSEVAVGDSARKRARTAVTSATEAALSSPASEASTSGSASERASTAATSVTEVAPSSPGSEVAVGDSAKRRARTAVTSATEAALSSPASEAVVSVSASERARTAVTSSVTEVAPSSPASETAVSGSARGRASTAATRATEAAPSSAASEAAVSGSASERAHTAAANATEAAPSSPGGEATVSGSASQRASVTEPALSSPASETVVSGSASERARTAVTGVTEAALGLPAGERAGTASAGEMGPDATEGAAPSTAAVPAQVLAVCAAFAEAPGAPSLGAVSQFASLHSLRAALVVRQAPVGARLAAVALVLAAVIGVFVSREQRTICQGAAARVDTVLSPARRSALAAHLQSLGADGPEAWGLIDHQLTTLVAAWEGMYQDSCEATRLRREQTDVVFAARSACLERRLVELSAALDVLESTTAASSSRAVDALAAVAPLSVCADVEALSRHADAPESPSLAPRVSELDRAYAHASALYEAGREPEAYTETQAVVANARALPWPSKEALALALLGELVRARGTPEAEPVLREAFRKCLATHEDEAAVGAATGLSYVLARRGEIAAAKEWLWQGQSLAARLGANPLLQARIELRAASLAFFQSDFPEAKKHAELAHSLRRKQLGDDHALTLSALFNVANALNGEHHFEEALALQRQIFESISTTHGLSYPLAGQSATGLAELFYNLRRYDEAVAIIERVLPAQRRIFGDDSLQVARLLLNQSNALTKTGRAETSLGLLTQARRIFDQQHALRLQGLVLDAQGEAYGSLGRLKEAHDAFEQSRTLISKAFGPNEDAVLTSTESEAEVLLANGHLAEAATLFERALAARTSQQQSDMVGYDLSFLGRVHARLGFAARAKEELAKAIDLLEASQTDAWALAETKAAYAALITPAIPSEGAR